MKIINDNDLKQGNWLYFRKEKVYSEYYICFNQNNIYNIPTLISNWVIYKWTSNQNVIKV